MRFPKFINVRGDLFATGSSFAAQGVIKLGSSIVLTRILRPDDYGVIVILMSIVFIVEMVADLGVTVFIVRDKNAEEPRYLNTAWTLRIGRATLNSMIMFALAPLIATHFYAAPALENPLRVFSVWFIIAGLESMSFPIAVRRKRSRIIVYSELAATFVSTVFTLIYCHYQRDYWGMVFGTLLNRLLITVITHFFYREFRPRFQIDFAAAKEILGLTKYTMPSSLVTLSISQFDKIVFLRLFDLTLLGVYGLGGNIAAPVEALITKISQMVLYPRCAHNYRADPSTFVTKYYTENTRLFVSILVVPAMIGGAARLLIAVLYDTRYARAAIVLQAFMIRAALLALASPAEDMLIASGASHVILVGQICRAIWVFAASLIGYYFFGFIGFTFGAALCGLPQLVYLWSLQRRKGMLIARYEAYKVTFIVVVTVAAYLASRAVAAILPTGRLTFH